MSNTLFRSFITSNHIITVFAVLLFSCKGKETSTSSAAADSASQLKPVGQIADSNWINSFNSFRNSVYKGDKAGVKSFFTFPLFSPGNEIWSIVPDTDPRSKNSFSDKPTPFEEADFDRYFSKLFDKDFIAAILKVKAKELYASGHFETPAVTDSVNKHISSFRMYADFDKKEHTLSLSLNYNLSSKNENGEEEFDGESSEVYIFDIIDNTRLKFKGIYFAG